MDNYNRVIYTVPYDSEVEYLRSSGSYIDSGIYANQSTKIEMRFCANNFNTASGGIIGVHTSESGHKSFAVLFSRIGTSGNYTGGIAYDSFNVKGGSTNIYLNEVGVYHTLVYRNGLLKFDNEEVYINFPDQETLDTMFIMRANGSSFSSPISVSYCKIWNGDTLVRDFIPVRVGNIGYMYDKVSGKLFGNQGTGNFILGNDVPNPVPKIRNVVYYSPYDAEVEYLECNQFNLQLPIKPSTNYTYRWGYKILQLSNWNYMFEAHEPNRPWFVFGGVETNSLTQLHIKSDANVSGKILQENVLYDGILCKEGNKINEYLNNVLYVNLPYQDYTAPGYLSIIGKHVQLYYLQILNENNNIIFDAIPVRIGSVGYMYDKVSKRLFGNSGTDNFILGNDVVKPNVRMVMPMPYDSRVEYIESDSNQYLDIGIIPKSGYRAICEYMPETNTSQTGVMALFGQRKDSLSSNMFDVFMGFGTNCLLTAQYANNRAALQVNNIPNVLHTIELGEKSYLDGNLLKTVTNTFNGAYTISIFAIHQNFQGSVNYNDRPMKNCRVYSFKLYNDSDTLIFDGIPVRRGTKGYMYDKVSGRLFGNLGTGQFILGTDIND